MSRTVPVPPVLCTGFDITEALWRYLEVGHDIPLVVADPPADEEDRIDEVIAALDRETILMMSFRQHFGLIRRTAPAEDRKLLEIPYGEPSKWPALKRRLTCLHSVPETVAVSGGLQMVYALVHSYRRVFWGVLHVGSSCNPTST